MVTRRVEGDTAFGVVGRRVALDGECKTIAARRRGSKIRSSIRGRGDRERKDQRARFREHEAN